VQEHTHQPEQRRPFLATSNGMILLLVIATIAPIVIPGAGVVASFMLPPMVAWIAYKRPEPATRWYILSAIPVVVYGIVVLMVLFGG
jgi:hypothetical protein